MLDFFSLQSPMKHHHDTHPMHLTVNQMSEGKTCHGKPQCGRATRHKDVRLCAVGAIAICVMNGEFTTQEFIHVQLTDWMENSSWFGIVFLTDCNNADTAKELASDTHADHIWKVLTRLHLPRNKTLHLGCNVGTKSLDCDEVDEGEIQRMGQWNQTICDESHSSKLPMKTIRSLAGHSAGSGLCHNARTQVRPTMELK